MADVGDIRQAIADALDTIDGLHVSDVWPDSVQTPQAIVQLKSALYRQAMGGDNNLYEFEVVLLASGVEQGLRHGQEILDPYVNSTTSKSVLRVLEEDSTLGDVVNSVGQIALTDYGTMTVGGIDYVGARWSVQIWT